MRKLLYVLFVLINLTCYGQEEDTRFPSQIKTDKTNNHIRIKGSKVFGVFPEEYHYFKELARYQKNDNLYIQVVESNVSFLAAQTNFTREAIEAKGVTVDVLENVTLNSFEGIYSEGPSKFPGETKLMLVFGDADFIVIVAGVCKTADTAGKMELQEIFRSIYYEKSLELDPMELADFEFDQSVTGFEYAMTASNMFIFMENGRADAKNPLANSMNFVVLPQMTLAKAEEYANGLPLRFEKSGIALDNKNVSKTEVGKYTAFILDANIEFQTNKGSLYQAILMGDDKCVVFIGKTYSNAEAILEQYKKTVATIKIR